MTRREMLSLAAGALRLSCGAEEKPDATLRIGAVTLDLGRGKSARTLGYNGQVPGPLLRLREGRPFTAEIHNDTAYEELVHWHGLHIPSDVDGAMEEGTPGIPPGGSRRYSFTPVPAGTRWYHSHTMPGKTLHRGAFTGQFGLLMVESSGGPGRYDLEIPLLLHEWEPALVEDDVEYKLFSINGKMLGEGEPVRVRQGQRVLFRIVNASASVTHRLGLPMHSFVIHSLDGNQLPQPVAAPIVELGPGERADAIVEMNRPGVWVLGAARDKDRASGCGIVVEYADRQGPPRWLAPPPFEWDYALFGESKPHPPPDGVIPMAFKETDSGRWTVNGKSFPHTDPLVVSGGRRYRLVFDNQSAMAHPAHLHRHTFEITRFAGKPTSGVFKDVVMVPAWKKVEVDLLAENPGPTLFHCHHALHMERGFMALMQYKE